MADLTPKHKVVNLMSALEASVKAAKSERLTPEERAGCKNCGRPLRWPAVRQAWLHEGSWWRFPGRQGYDQPKATHPTGEVPDDPR